MSSPRATQTCSESSVYIQTPLSYRKNPTYMKKVSEMELAGNRIEFDGNLLTPDYEVRCSKNDHSIVLPDILVACRAYPDTTRATRAINNIMQSDDNKLSDLKTLRKDFTLQPDHLQV